MTLLTFLTQCFFVEILILVKLLFFCCYASRTYSDENNHGMWVTPQWALFKRDGLSVCHDRCNTRKVPCQICPRVKVAYADFTSELIWRKRFLPAKPCKATQELLLSHKINSAEFYSESVLRRQISFPFKKLCPYVPDVLCPLRYLGGQKCNSLLNRHGFVHGNCQLKQTDASNLLPVRFNWKQFGARNK